MGQPETRALTVEDDFSGVGDIGKRRITGEQDTPEHPVGCDAITKFSVQKSRRQGHETTTIAS